ncbi:tRNA (adenine(22)-N(1))-methyltransferase TrmK, partial [Anaerosalibacter bizertensis]|nr:tRNA (adenine(22)-N(1))-methyltransferase TrmK [Anaerosalibacter bizertensis]
LKIVDEKIIKEEDRYYEIIYVKWGKDYIEDEIYYEISKKLLDRKDPLLKEFLEFKIEKTEKILEELEKKDTEKVAERRRGLYLKIDKYKEVLKTYESN